MTTALPSLHRSWSQLSLPWCPQHPSLAFSTSWMAAPGAVTWGPPAPPLAPGQAPGVSPRVWEEAWSAPAASPSLGSAWEDRASVWLSKRGQWRHPVGWWAGREGGTHLSTVLVSQCPSSAKPAPKSNEHKENCEKQLHGSCSLISDPKAVLKSITQKNP